MNGSATFVRHTPTYEIAMPSHLGRNSLTLFVKALSCTSAPLFVVLRCGAILSSLLLTGTLQAEEPAVDYDRHIKPLFAARCIACHGVLKQEAGLRLDTGELARKGAESGPVIVSSDAAHSVLLKRVTATDESQRMPPEGEPLTAAQIEQLKTWIRSGAFSPADEKPEPDPREHWAFQTIERPQPPALPASWGRNPIDAFVAAGQAAHGLQPQVPANRLELIRRLYIDLIGLPPTLQDWSDADRDVSDGWYERLVERLLNDPRYGQRWARHWMDVWRYSDWWGLGDQLRNSQLHMWHWRDWLVESLNADMPYDQMVRLMLAADELSPTDTDKLRATGYLARNYFLFNRHQWMDETVEHVSKGLLGLTMNCAKCHDHKYDPIDQTDYYRLRAFFEPYYVRMDMLPGESDLARNGLPRVFETQADAPTYRFIRGQETQPDKSTAIAPGIPAIVALDPLKIEPRELPAAAWQPERQEFVAEAYRQAADGKIDAANRSLAKARERVRELEAARAKPSESDPVAVTTQTALTFEPFADRFENLNSQHWRVLDGQWVHEAGSLKQLRDGATSSVLRLIKSPPQDFEATLKFTLLGGSRWRSVCLSFDAIGDKAGESRDSASSDTLQTVYVSAVEGGSKLQASFSRDGKRSYPADGAVPRPIALNQLYTLRLLVRGNLINAYLNDELLLAWNSPLERKQGFMQLETFDAIAAFSSFELKALDASVSVQAPGGQMKDAAKELASAQREVEFAERDLQIAQQEKELLALKWAALRADWKVQDALSASADKSADAEPVASNQTKSNQEELKQASAQAHRDAIALTRQLEVTKAQRALDGLQANLSELKGAKLTAAEKQVKSAREALEKAQKALGEEIKPTDKAAGLAGAKWVPTRFLNSGADDPAIAFGPKSSGRRSALAEWITDRRNPLTARVAVNHLWTRHFGASLVETPFDFGRKTPEPRHRLLIDWLAAEFMESGWSIKHLHRLIVNSDTYRMSSTIAGQSENVAKDPDNHWLWRRQANRIESQVVRDGILALAGTLDASAGGPPIMPSDQANSHRRSLYFFHSNNERNLFLTTFDEAAVKECYRREQSIVPQQALALTNSQLVLDAAKPMAESILKSLPAEAATDDNRFATQAFRSILGIEPSQAECQASAEAMRQWRHVGDLQQRGPHELLVWALLNHNDFVTLR